MTDDDRDSSSVPWRTPPLGDAESCKEERRCQDRAEGRAAESVSLRQDKAEGCAVENTSLRQDKAKGRAAESARGNRSLELAEDVSEIGGDAEQFDNGDAECEQLS